MKGYKDISGKYWSNLKNGAAKRAIDFDLDKKDIWKLITIQNYKCALTGVDISFKNKTASIDRNDSRREYTLENVQIIHKEVNFAKQSMTNEEFFGLCLLVVKQLSAIYSEVQALEKVRLLLGSSPN